MTTKERLHKLDDEPVTAADEEALAEVQADRAAGVPRVSDNTRIGAIMTDRAPERQTRPAR